MQKLPSISLLFAALALLSTLGARSAIAAPLDLAALGSGSALPLPSPGARPFMISGSKVVPGIQVVSAERFTNPGVAGYHEHALFAEPEHARAYEAQLKNGTPPPFTRSDACFATPSDFGVRVPEDLRPPPEWDVQTAERFTAQTFLSDTSAKVVPVRAERWLEADGKVRVETTVAWVDLGSGGVQLIARADNELKRIASPYPGVAVYAMRSGPGAVSFFVRRDAPRAPASPELNPLPRLGFVQLGRANGGPFDLGVFHATVQAETRTNPCAFAHIELEIRPDAPAEEPPAQAKARRSRASKGLSVSVLPPREVANVVFAVVLDLETEPVPDPAGSDAPAQPSSEPRTTAQVRTMIVNLGLARSLNGGTPVPSVSYRWLERRRAVSF